MTDRVAVIALVAQQDWAPWHPFQQQVCGRAVSDLATRQKESDGAAQAIGQGVDLGGAAAPRTADRLIALPPFPPDAQRCAFTAEESIRTCAGGSPAEAKAWKMSTQTPLAAHRTNPIVEGLVRSVD